MTQSSKRNRIIFIDLMRAFAVLMMVQGHTVDVLLSGAYRIPDSPVYVVWNFMRGMTAPIFLFTAGNVFTYLFKLYDQPFGKNPRFIKGIKRFLLLVFLGYMMRYPTEKVFNFSNVSPAQWQTFFAVDVLQLIGFGILFLMFFIYLSEKLKINTYLVLTLGALLFIALFPPFSFIHWKDFLPMPVAGYFYNQTGSNFPLFPWVAYVLAGGMLGNYLAQNPNVFKNPLFSLKLAVWGASFVFLAMLGNIFENMILGQSYFWSVSPNLVFLRIGIVLILNSLVSLISLKVDTIPRIIILIGRNTLLIYIVHLVMLYGSAWSLGVNVLFAGTYNIWETIGSVILMLLLMILMVELIHKFKIRNKELVT
ncbi:MAG TPA: acyltransferase family protein [Ignavibacteriaceae bacterium]|nr:acyltransferase family protein [Ignavibacteriaceae bacterium]